LDDADALLREGATPGAPALLTAEEAATEKELLQQSATLPLNRLMQKLSLSPFEQEAVLLCAAPELDRSYERIYAYILDDLNRRWPCIELLSSLTADSLNDQIARHRTLGRFGKLRRASVLQPHGEAATELRQELRLAPGAFEFLTGTAEELLGIFHDPAEIAITESIALPQQIDREKINRLGGAIANRSAN